MAVAQPYRLATVCLVALSAALLVTVIIVAAQHREDAHKHTHTLSPLYDIYIYIYNKYINCRNYF